MRCQNAVAAVRAKALDKCLSGLEASNNFSKRDRGRMAGETEATSGTSLGCNEAGVGKLADNFGQVIARDGELHGDFIGREHAIGRTRKAHQGSEPVVGESREAHGRSARIGIANAEYTWMNRRRNCDFEDDMSGEPHDVRDAVARRAAFAAEVQARTGIDEDMIRRLVHTFYDRIRADEVLGPIFSARIADWAPHLERMCAFWSSVTLMTGRYHGRPMQAHAPLPIGGAHFDRWLALFADTANEVCPAAAASYFVERARMIAESLELGIGTVRGLMLAKGQRLPALDCT